MALWNQQEIWSGRPDSNWRPPTPKSVAGILPNFLIFNCLRCNLLRAFCWNVLSLVEFRGFMQQQNHLHFKSAISDSRE